METIPLAEAKAHLSKIADHILTTQDRVEITKHGRRALALVSTDYLDSLQETIFWLSTPGIQQDLAESETDLAEGRTLTTDEVRERFLARKAAETATDSPR